MKQTLIVLSLVSGAFAQQVPAPPAAAVPAAAKGSVVQELSRGCWYLFQAKNGDYWFGSEDRGVYRYDGTRIVNYTTADGLSGNQVRGIQGDRAGHVYFTTAGGICRFDGRGFSTLTPVDPPDREAGGGWRLHADDLWFGGGKGVLRFDGTTLYDLKLPKSDLEEAFNAKYAHHRTEPYAVYSIFRDGRGHLWIGTQNFGVIRYDGKSCGWLYEEHHTYVPGGGLFGLRAVIEDKSGVFWICNTRYRYRVEPENKDGKVPYTREEGIDPKMSDGEAVYFQGAEMDAKGDLWFSPYGGGIYRWDGKSMTNYPVRDGGRDTQVFKIFKDNGGVMWLGTPTAGPFRFNGAGFEQFKP